MIDRTLNYGRDQLRDFLRAVDTCQTALDIGAGRGYDLASVRQVQPGARRLAVECFPPNIQELQGQGVEVHSLNIEKDPLPFAAESLDVIMANQILEHTKEVFWILH